MGAAWVCCWQFASESITSTLNSSVELQLGAASGAAGRQSEPMRCWQAAPARGLCGVPGRGRHHPARLLLFQWACFTCSRQAG